MRAGNLATLARPGDVIAVLLHLRRVMELAELRRLERSLGAAICQVGGELERLQLWIFGDPREPTGWIVMASDQPSRLFHLGLAMLGSRTERLRMRADAFGLNAEADPDARAKWALGCLAELVEGRNAAILLEGVALTSPLRDAIRTCGLASTQRNRPGPHYSIEAAAGFATYVHELGSANARRMVRRATRRLDKPGPAALELRQFTQPDEVGDFLSAVHDICLIRRPGPTPRSSELQPRLALLARLGWWKGAVLYRGRQAVAFVEGSACGGAFLPMTTGYRHDRTTHSAGWTCLVGMIRALTDAHSEIRRIDLGPGGWEYKRRLSNRAVVEADYFLYRPSIRHQLLFASTSLVRRLSSAVARLG